MSDFIDDLTPYLRCNGCRELGKTVRLRCQNCARNYQDHHMRMDEKVD